MFERKEPFQWKIPILILTGILVLSGGIYIGVKTRKVEEKPAFNNETINEENEETIYTRARPALWHGRNGRRLHRTPRPGARRRDHPGSGESSHADPSGQRAVHIVGGQPHL